MATTPQRAWHYPDEFENPYWTSFVSFAEGVDSDVDSLFTSRLGGTGAAGQVGYFTAGTTLASGPALLFANTSPALVSVVGGSLRLTVTNPTLVTADYSFFTSPKGIAVDVAFTTAQGVAIHGQADVTTSEAGSTQGVSGVTRVNSASEVYGVMGFVDWQHVGAYGAGMIAISRGGLADPGVEGSQGGLAAVSEGNFPSSNGIVVNSSNAPSNSWHTGIFIIDSLDYGIRLRTNGIGVSMLALAPGTNETALLLDRAYTVGATHDILFCGSGTGAPASTKIGAIKMHAWTAGETGFSFCAQTGGADAYSNEVFRVNGNGSYVLSGLSSAGARYVKTNSTGVLSGQATPIPVSDGGTGAATLAAGYLKGNGTSAVTSQAAPIPVSDGGTGVGTLTGYVKGNGTGAFTAQATPIPVADGGTGAGTLTGYLKGNGTSAVTAQTTPIPVADGGTGASTLTANALLYGNGTSALLSATALRISAAAGLTIFSTGTAGAEAKVGLMLDREYDAVGDTQEIVWAAGTGMTGSQAAAIKVGAVGGGEMGFSLYAMSGGGTLNGYTNQIARFDGSGYIAFKGLAGTGVRYVKANADGSLTTTSTAEFRDEVLTALPVLTEIEARLTALEVGSRA